MGLVQGMKWLLQSQVSSVGAFLRGYGGVGDSVWLCMGLLQWCPHCVPWLFGVLGEPVMKASGLGACHLIC